MPGGLIPTAPVPAGAPMPNADPRDLQGTWIHNQKLEFRMQRDMYDAPVPYNMSGAKVLARRVNSLKNGAPFINASAMCRPPGPQWQRDLNFPFQIFQSKDWIEFVFEEYHGRWQVVLDPAKAPPPAQKAYMGYSVGHWIGDTLVVESSDFKQALWLDVDGTPLSANGKLIQRIRKVDNGDHAPFLEVITTIVDPTYYTRPWSVVRTFGWHPGLTVFNEYNCEEQIGDPSVVPTPVSFPNPKTEIRLRKPYALRIEHLTAERLGACSRFGNGIDRDGGEHAHRSGQQEDRARFLRRPQRSRCDQYHEGTNPRYR
jgi:hypothetical protein